MTNDYGDLRNLTVDKSQPLDKRLNQYIMDTKTPYTVRIDNTLVQIKFVGDKSFSAALCEVFRG